ncbi:citrate synthase [Pusillimonas sp.]|uniref:citrate synthase n=1 Tax=Pusillimonas sp. TaxID=3040095 RepID=UPI0029A67106|nr:citrate synthase [Pusillimonas sp.]MDX3895555.1 citrate synthase [Pusillimonas sp.]
MISAKEACAILDVKLATLYTYVSRGKLHPIAQGGKRTNLYLRQEVENLLARTVAFIGPTPMAGTGVLRKGLPVINSSITEITDQGPRYRGHLASDLVRYPGGFEGVAELLWSGVLPNTQHVWPVEPPEVDIRAALDAMHFERMPSLRMMRVLSITATAMGGGTLVEELRSGSITRYSRQMLFAFAGCFGILGPDQRYHEAAGEQPIAAHIVDALGLAQKPQVLDAINAGLITTADHDLSPSTFSARVAASAGAGLHACIVAALGTHVGVSLAGGCDQADQLIRGFNSQNEINERVAQAERNRERLPGFTLPLYPHGDPRAALLIDMAHKLGAPSKQADMAFRFIESVERKLGMPPNVAAGLVALCLAAGLPERAASTLWGTGRTVGWIAHVLEQRLAGFVLRPRSHYIVSGTPGI